jgi:hypothetical protein
VDLTEEEARNVRWKDRSTFEAGTGISECLYHEVKMMTMVVMVNADKGIKKVVESRETEV